jgi:hypothetical protein
MSDPRNFRHLETVYSLAIQNGDYQSAVVIAIRGIRTRVSDSERAMWMMRLGGCVREIRRRRHDHVSTER